MGVISGKALDQELVVNAIRRQAKLVFRSFSLAPHEE
jgi:hypothetical protein